MSKRKPKSSEIAAIEDLKKKIRIANSKGNFREVASLHNALGNQYRLLGHYEEALEQHQEEIRVCIKYNKNDRLGLAIAYRNVGEVLLEMKEGVKAIASIKKYLQIARELENYVEEQRANITMGRVYFTLAGSCADEDGGDNDEIRSSKKLHDKAYSCFKNAYNLLGEDQLRRQIEDEKEYMQMKCNNCQNLGLVLESMGKLTEAISWLSKAVDIGVKYNFHEYLAPSYTVLAGIRFKNGELKKALDAARSATKSYRVIELQSEEVESILLESKIMFSLGDVEGGKKILKRLRKKVKKKSELQDYLEELDSLLIAAIKVCRAQDTLFIVDKSDFQQRLKLHEIMGDNFTTLGDYEEAIENYKSSCQYAEKLGIKGKKLAKLYFSVAETYKDLEKFDEAYEYYLKEMEIYSGNVMEEFKTQTNIALILEKLQKPTNEVIAAHKVAIALAKTAKSLSKEVTAIRNFGLYLKSVGQQDEAEKQLKLADKIKEDNNLPDVEDDDPDSQDILDDEDDEIDLDNLSEDADSEEEGDEDRKSKKKFSLRKNEAGETPLHISAKKGELKRIVKLLRNGHPVNVRDYANWAPLHEAANFGHAQIVDELLKAGANVDAIGGLGEKITPLHDAAGNCHSETIMVLLKYNADVLAKDAQGLYPIDHLISWRKSDAGQTASEEQIESYREIKEILREKMADKGTIYRREDEMKVIKKKAKARHADGPEMSLLVTKEHEIDCPIPVTIATDDYDPDDAGEGAKLYKNAMNQVRRKDTEVKVPRKTRAISPGPQGALIPAELDVHESWLLPDDTITTKENEVVKISSTNSKRKRDSMEDVHQMNNRRRRRRRRTNSSESVRQSRRRNSGRLSSDENMEIDDDTHTNVSPTPEILHDMDNFMADEELKSLLDNDNDMDVLEDLDQDQFLPSQRPSSSTMEFGRTVDIPVSNHYSSDEESRRSSVSSREHRPSSRSRGSPVIQLSSDEDDDYRSAIRKAKRKSLAEVANAFKQTNRSLADRTNKPRKSLVQSRLPVQKIQKSRQIPEPPGQSSSRDSSPEVGINRRGIRRNSSSTSLTSSHTSQFAVRQKADIWRLKIRVLGLNEVLLVPVDEAHQNESIEWLASECAMRYSRQHGIKPLLTLQTKDGATLSGSDPISLVISETERELDAHVTGFDQPPLTERYCTACAEASIEPDPDLQTSLNICQSSNVLDLTDSNLRGKSGTTLFKALQRQSSLRVLTLSGCSLFDFGLNELCKILPTLPHLAELDLSSNGITSKGLSAFADIFREASCQAQKTLNSVPFGLTSLKLSFNPLGNLIGMSLVSLLHRLTSLKCLEMVDCNLTEKLFASNFNDLKNAFNSSRLEDVDISYNNLNTVGLEKFLQCLPARKIRSLKCSSCSLSSNDVSTELIARSISSFLSQNEDCCNLKLLELNDCSLNDRALNMIIDNFGRLVRLESLELNRNSDLTSTSLVKILQQSVEENIPLIKLDFGSIPNFWDNPQTTEEMILSALENKMCSDKKLLFLKLPSSTAENPFQTDSEKQGDLSKLETRIFSLMEDYAGTMLFTFEKCGSSIVYRYED